MTLNDVFGSLLNFTRERGDKRKKHIYHYKTNTFIASPGIQNKIAKEKGKKNGKRSQ